MAGQGCAGRETLGSCSRFFSGQDPIDRFSRVGLELQQDVGRGSAQSQLVFGKLGLGDAQDASEFVLCEVESSYLPDASSDRFEIRGSPLRASRNIRLTRSHISCILFSLRLVPLRSCRALYTAQEGWEQQSGPRDLNKIIHRKDKANANRL